MTRSYEQSCVIARALDVLGERWTLLIVRELTLGPRRYGDLLRALPSMGTNLLAARLKHLEQHEVLQRTTLPGPGRASAYSLTLRGEKLLPVLESLVEWGAGLGSSPADYTDRPEWCVVAMSLTAAPEAAEFTTVTELHIGEETLWIQGESHRAHVEMGRAPTNPGLRLSCEKETFYDLAKKRTTVDSAIEAGDLTVDGDVRQARRFFDVFSLPEDMHAS
ncbi:winged helix-turn-helix transcriptional regulator [Streptomyces graminifolii]|uniref:winged helix-turn-helix transcriptional regulator n=1 Tax=Streptomyces graminifolii TaxID=1266771 RepID=UPI00405863A7